MDAAGNRPDRRIVADPSQSFFGQPNQNRHRCSDLRGCRMKKFLMAVSGFIILGGLFLGLHAHAAFDPNRLIDDAVFSNSGSMSASQIDNFLNSFPYSCISTNSGFAARIPSGYSPSAGFTYGDFASAGNVIARSAQVYGLNP